MTLHRETDNSGWVPPGHLLHLGPPTSLQGSNVSLLSIANEDDLARGK